jgi:hypothetical protein
MRRFAHIAATIAGVVVFGSLLWSSPANAQEASPPEVPASVQTRPGEKVVLLAHASGSQIYVCRVGTDGRVTWTLKAPEAELTDRNGKVIGNHSAGPTWKLKDGSEVSGKTLAHVDSPDPAAIPWLLVSVVNHSGKGVLTNVTMIQRVHTHGGNPPLEGCDESHRDAQTKSSYTADYYFYAPTK